MRKAILLLVCGLGCGVLPTRAQIPLPSCGSTGDILLRTFLPQLAQNSAGDLTKLLSPYEQDYHAFLQARDRQTLSRALAGVQPGPRYFDESQLQQAQFNLENALSRFYAVGAQLYGVELSPRLIISPSGDVNAFATGATVVVNEGLIAYYLAPQSFVLTQVASRQGGSYTSDQYNWARQQFPWQNDWASLYFIVAHEAAHNLMRHPDQAILQTGVSKLLNRYVEQVRNERHDLAYGKVGFGTHFVRFLMGSLESFDQLLNDPAHQREKESEADTVALVLLVRAGLGPGSGPTALEHLLALLGQGLPSGGFLTQALCADHPATGARVGHLRVELACVRSDGNPCEMHVTFPIEQSVQAYQQKMAELHEYQRQTREIAASAPPGSTQAFLVEIKVKPKDAAIAIDGAPRAAGQMSLREGPHQVEVSREGYRTESRKIVVYPDVQIKIKIGLKKQK